MTKIEFNEIVIDIVDRTSPFAFTGIERDYNIFIKKVISKIYNVLYNNEIYYEFINRVYADNLPKKFNTIFTNLYIELEVGLFNYVVEFDIWDDFFIKKEYTESEILSLFEGVFKNGN